MGYLSVCWHPTSFVKRLKSDSCGLQTFADESPGNFYSLRLMKEIILSQSVWHQSWSGRLHGNGGFYAELDWERSGGFHVATQLTPLSDIFEIPHLPHLWSVLTLLEGSSESHVRARRWIDECAPHLMYLHVQCMFVSLQLCWHGTTVSRDSSPQWAERK